MRVTSSSERRGRKIKRETGHRSPACKACQQRKVKCSGGSPCSACCRKAAWDGVPPPEYCEYDGGFIPARKPGSSSSSRQPAGSGDEVDNDTGDNKGKGKGKGTRPLQKGLACLACKARRVRCDGAKPACGSCMRTAKREYRDPCCFYRADLHVAQQQLLDGRPRPPPAPRAVTEEPHDSPPPRAPSPSGSASPRAGPSPEKIPESALPPLPVVAVVESPDELAFPQIPTVACRASSSNSISSALSRHPNSHPPSPSLTHTSTDPSSSHPSPATPYSSAESMVPRDAHHHVDNYPPLPYPPATCDQPDSIWAVPHLALGAAVSNAPDPAASQGVHALVEFPTCESVEFQTVAHDLDLTLTLPMSPPATFTNLSGTPVKTEPGSNGAEWWTQ
ncbi:hypothetical protein JCM3766R1_000054 [Sporobolomyces carnicolor]